MRALKNAPTPEPEKPKGFNPLAAAKAMFKQYWEGIKLLRKETGIARDLQNRSKTEGYELTRRDYMLIKRNQEDIKRLYPFFALLIILPESIPIVLLRVPSMIPSTCQSQEQVEKRWKQARENRLQIGKEATSNLDQYGLHAPVESFLSPSFLFSLSRDASAAKRFSVDSLSPVQLKTINKYLGLWRFGPAAMLRGPLKSHLEVVRGDDEYLIKEGIESLDVTELRAANEARGISTSETSVPQLQADLRSWLELRQHGRKEGVDIPDALMVLTAAVRVGVQGGMAEEVKVEEATEELEGEGEREEAAVAGVQID
ncbi:hypothetical protein HDV00_004119 [Rhizophlyctis rosea]|nr:hypothetical protein HDV00_004119 [Rhizophlyctis rosea]